MLDGLKIFKRKKLLWNNFRSWCARVFFKTDVLKIWQKRRKTTAPGSLLNNAADPQQIFTGDCFSNLLEFSMVFGQVKKYNENVYISLKTKSKHQVT